MRTGRFVENLKRSNELHAMLALIKQENPELEPFDISLQEFKLIHQEFKNTENSELSIKNKVIDSLRLKKISDDIQEIINLSKTDSNSTRKKLEAFNRPNDMDIMIQLKHLFSTQYEQPLDLFSLQKICQDIIDDNNNRTNKVDKPRKPTMYNVFSDNLIQTALFFSSILPFDFLSDHLPNILILLINKKAFANKPDLSGFYEIASNNDLSVSEKFSQLYWFIKNSNTAVRLIQETDLTPFFPDEGDRKQAVLNAIAFFDQIKNLAQNYKTVGRGYNIVKKGAYPLHFAHKF